MPQNDKTDDSLTQVGNFTAISVQGKKMEETARGKEEKKHSK